MKFYREAKINIKLVEQNYTNYLPTEINISGLRVSFSILKSLYHSTNPAVIKIWNISQNTRNLIHNFGDEVTVFAGYVGEAGAQQIFIGQTTAVSHIYDQPEIVTVLECGDGEKYLNQLRVSLSFAAGTPARIIIDSIAKQMGLPVYEYSASNNLIYHQAVSEIDLGAKLLTTFCNKLGLQWSVQNGGLQIIPINGTIAQPFININQNTGMQGIPQRYTYKRFDLFRAEDAPNSGYKVNVALNPLILPGAGINLYSSHIDFKGPYRVENVRHEGDTYGSIWQSNLEVTELKPPLPS